MPTDIKHVSISNHSGPTLVRHSQKGFAAADVDAEAAAAAATTATNAAQLTMKSRSGTS